jgi:hypothetical protein
MTTKEQQQRMTKQEVDLREATAAVLKGFSPRFTDLVVNVLELRNTVMATPDGNNMGSFADVRAGYGFMVMAYDGNDIAPFTMTNEFLVPSNELAASFMVMWQRWCNRRGINSKDGLLSLMNRVATEMKEHSAKGNQDSSSDLAMGLMGAVLDNYPEIVTSMHWSVDNGHAPCIVIANDNNQAKCGICYGGTYMTPEMESQIYGTM